VVAKIRSLRDVLVTLFVVALGMQIQIPSKSMMVAVGALTLVTILSRFITVMPPMRILRYGVRMGALTSIALAQVSEFSLVIVALGHSLGHIDRSIVSLVAIVLVITSTLSTYMVMVNHRIANWLDRLFGRAGVQESSSTESQVGASHAPAVLLIGCHRIGASLVEYLTLLGTDFSVIDFSPEVHRKSRGRKIRCSYGDISHEATLEHAGIREAKILVCTIPNDYLRGIDNERLFQILKKVNPTAKIIMTAERLSVARALYDLGADYVVIPRWLAADRLAQLIKNAETGSLDTPREAEMKKLREADEVVP
jgi:voltage-gated potassium channel Kch